MAKKKRLKMKALKPARKPYFVVESEDGVVLYCGPSRRKATVEAQKETDAGFPTRITECTIVSVTKLKLPKQKPGPEENNDGEA